MPRGKNEAVPVGPVGVFGIVTEEFGKDGVSHGCHRHRGSGVAGVGFLHRVHRKGPDGIYREFGDVLGLEIQSNPFCRVLGRPYFTTLFSSKAGGKTCACQHSGLLDAEGDADCYGASCHPKSLVGLLFEDLLVLLGGEEVFLLRGAQPDHPAAAVGIFINPLGVIV